MDRNPCTTNVQVAPEYSEHEVSGVRGTVKTGQSPLCVWNPRFEHR